MSSTCIRTLIEVKSTVLSLEDEGTLTGFKLLYEFKEWKLILSIGATGTDRSILSGGGIYKKTTSVRKTPRTK